MTDEPTTPRFLAALDLGSNSFHLAIARVVGGRLQMIDRIHDRVQLAAGLDAAKQLDAVSQERALAALERFGQRLRDFPGATVRAVGTDTLRVAQNAEAFRERASLVLGHPIEVLAGEEEARLIYSGVVHGLPEGDGARQLVIDIGGGSTECILGAGLNPDHLDSLHVGCVSFSKRFFPDRAVTRDRFRAAQIAAQLAFERLPAPFFAGDWQRVFGSSGTFIALEEICRANGWSNDGLTREALTRLRDLLIAQGHADRFQVPGLKPNRTNVIAAGLAIARAAFKALPISRIQTTTWALREGVLYELLRRFSPGDILDTTIARVIERFHIDARHGRQVAATAVTLFDQSGLVAGAPEEVRRLRAYLDYAARLHEIGMAIGFHGYHKHGAYILANTPLPGFSQDDARVLAALVLSHRRRFAREAFAQLPRHLREPTLRAAVLLRIATHLHRMRGEVPTEGLRLTARGRALTLTFPSGFLATHPLTVADFEDEARRLAPEGFTLSIQ
jgi:exopolyphosphatase/guanosine-5'-triphosphate,3'-diphosphate pyrophosphatase